MADGGGAVLLRHQRQLRDREPVGEGGVGAGSGGGGAVGRLLAHADDVLAHAALVEVRLQQLRVQLLGPPQQRRSVCGKAAGSVARLARGDVRVLVATPGRLADVLDRCPSLDLRRVEVLVLDEADRLLDMGFRPQLAAILDRLPRQRRTGLFSATQPDGVQELVRAGLRNPVRVHVHAQAALLPAPLGAGPAGAPPSSVADASSQTPSGLSIEYMICEATEKPSQLVHFLQQHKDKKLIVYFLTCACVDYWALALPLVLDQSCALPVFALHGKMKQRAREKVLADFSKLDVGALFCTDVAARGLDIPDVDWIVQFDPPQDPTSFVHRVGRTARMGKSGNALTFLLTKEESYVEFLGIRHVPVCPRSKATDIHDITSKLRAAALKDRKVMETGLRAFVSFVRGYKEHHCNYIFRYKELDLGDLAIEFGLLQLPSMPELRKSKLKVSTRFQAIPSMDFNTISYKDKAREKQRQSNLDKAILTKALRKRPGTKGLIEVSESRYGGKTKAPSHRRDDVVGLDGDDDLEADYRLLRKLKRGVIDDEQFEEAVMKFARVYPDKKASDSSGLGDGGTSKVVIDSVSPKGLTSSTPSLVHNSHTDSLQRTSRKHSQKRIRRKQ
eukprot:SM000080S22980  [mRNA]  locus=s80:515932:519385:+ [translate_table: standard]